jgi:hypothetical protein
VPIELFIEQWSTPTGAVLYPWSIWKDGKQVHYGQRLNTPKEAEQEGLHTASICWGKRRNGSRGFSRQRIRNISHGIRIEG